MPLSSTSLFHYTRGGMPVIKGILSEGFRVSYSKELSVITIANNESQFNGSVLTLMPTPGHTQVSAAVHYLRIPMVCFCDIRISSIKEHLKTYGFKSQDGGLPEAYAIGLSKEWGKKQNLNPVLYLVSGNKLAKQISGAYLRTQEVLDPSPYNYYRTEKYMPPRPMGEDYLIYDNKGNQFPSIFLYSKPIGKIRYVPYDKRYDENYQDEKEWRYVPESAEIIADFDYLDSTHNRQYYMSIERNALKAQQEAIRYDNLCFSHNDINHIIVSKNAEILDMYEFLESNFKSLEKDDIAVLLSKVISYERLEHDM